MNNKAPILIKRIEENKLQCKWNDGFSGEMSFIKLRQMCPCASCNEERERLKQSKVPVLNTFIEGMNEIKEINPVGNYAITVIWGDGHDTGIYTWEYLRQIFEDSSE